MTFWPAILKFWSKSFTYCLFASLLTGSCSDGDGSSTEDEGSNNIIHLPNNFLKRFNIMEQMGFQSFEVIPLELQEKSLLRGNGFQEVLYQDGYFILYERINEPIFIFDSEGQYLRKMEIIGKGPGELASVSDISTSSKPAKIHVLDYMQQRILAVDLTSSHTPPVMKPTNKIKEEYGYMSSIEKTDNGYLFIATKNGTNDNQAVLQSDANGNILKIVPFSLVDNSYSNSFGSTKFIKSNNEIILLKALSDTIWTWKDHNLVPKYIIPFPEELSDSKRQELPPNHFQYRSYLESNHFLYLTFMLGNSDFFYFYDKINNKGSLNNQSEVGIGITPGTPFSDYIHLSDSIVYGYMSQFSIEMSSSNLKNTVEGNGNFEVSDEYKKICQDEWIRLQPAVKEGNGAIVRYQLE